MSGFSCVICADNYTSVDEIYATYCGHVYHYQCMQESLRRTAACPTCRTPNPQFHRIYLDFTGDPQAERNLRRQLEESVSNADSLREELDESLEEVRSLEGSILRVSELQQQLDQSDRDYLELQNLLCGSEQKNGLLREECDNLKVIVESVNYELARLTSENSRALKSDDKLPFVVSELDITGLNASSLQTKLEQTERVAFELQKQLNESDVKLKTHKEKVLQLEEQIAREQNGLTQSQSKMPALFTNMKVLEDRVRMLTIELDKEIKKSTDLEMENLKYRSLLRTSSMQNLASTALNLHPAGMQSQSITVTGNDCNSINNNNFAKKTNINNNDSSSKPLNNNNNNNIAAKNENQLPNSTNDNNNRSGHPAHSVVIKKIPKTTIGQFSPNRYELFVLELAKKMDLDYKDSDIEAASLLERHVFVRNNIIPPNVSLLVRFKTEQLKNEFLANKEKLNVYDDTKQLIINVYLLQKINKLFECAKELRKFGYKNIFCKHQNVFIKKDSSSPVIKILNEQHINQLIQQEMLRSLSQ